MVDLRIFANARFSAASFAVTMIFFGLFGWLFLFTQQLQFVLGYDALQAGVRALPFAFTMGVVSPAAAQLAARVGTKVVVAGGLAIMAGGLAMVSMSTVHTTLPVPHGRQRDRGHRDGAGHGACDRVDHGLPAALEAGVGSAVNDTTREIGGALGVAIIGSVASSLFAGRLHPFLAHVPAPAATEAKASVGAAVTVGSHTPGAVGQLLVEAARQAFVTSTDRAVLVAVAAAMLGSLVALRFLPARSNGEVFEVVPAQLVEA